MIKALEKDFDQTRRILELSTALSMLNALRESYASRKLQYLRQAEKALKKASAIEPMLKRRRVAARINILSQKLQEDLEESLEELIQRLEETEEKEKKHSIKTLFM